MTHKLNIETFEFPIDSIEKEWKEAWGSPPPRRTGSYPITHYIVAVHIDDEYRPEDKGKPVGYLGYHRERDFVWYGDAFVHPEFRNKAGVGGVYSTLVHDRDVANSKPKIAGLRPKDTPLPEYLEMQKTKGWKIAPDDETIARDFPSFPKEVINMMRKKYLSEEGKATWALKKYDDAFDKTWMRITLKDFEPVGE